MKKLLSLMILGLMAFAGSLILLKQKRASVKLEGSRI